ncbi:MAG: ribosomal protein S5 [Minisyncoccales bacterium]
MAKKQGKKNKKGDFKNNVLDIARTNRMTAGGRQMRFRAVVAVGNEEGKIGVGVAKGEDVSKAIQKAEKKAKKDIVEIPITEEGTISREVKAKFGPSEILLIPQQKGRGLVAGGTVRVICNLLGIDDISSKVISRTRNKLNNARATIKALKKLKYSSPKSKK